MKWQPELTMNGLKIMCMKFEHMTFLDSICFLPLPLRKLSEAFGLSASKSFYPHYFNTKENLEYVGTIPDIAMFGASDMSERERRDFLEWYEGQKDKEFDNKRVLEQYCQDDVTVLRQACQLFRREFMAIGNIDVFLESVTIASACNKVLRKKFLTPDTIGIIPTGGYTGNANYSKKAIMWLIYKEKEDACKILHARNGREFRLPQLPNLRVDGYCHVTNTVYEFLGCLWHGHTCLPFRDVPTMGGETLAERYENTMVRLERIRRAGYQVKIQWECDFDKDILPRHPNLKTHKLVEQSPLNTRDALYGGRTEAMLLHYKVKEGETIEYCDIMSLYPYICKYSKFPVAHPTVHAGDDCKDTEAMLKKEGLIKCCILPPRHLYHPVLPYRCNKKLLFCLCRTCAMEQNTTSVCKHQKVSERALIGTWVMDEVRLAVSKGYRVVEIYEVYEYEVTQYDKQTGTGGLFVDYIDTFLKLKAEASGYPSWVRGPEDEERYVQSFKDSEGIELQKDAISPNPAKRALAKLCLNSMWGKLTERNNRTKSQMISEPQELYRFLSTPGIEVVSLMFPNDTVVWAFWRYVAEEKIPNLRHTNEVIGAYVTTGARIHLYKYLDRLGTRAIYTDTDSVVYIQDESQPRLVEVGDRLGDMTNELQPDEFIQEFVSGGPKNYAY
jgi:G:T-mismatch repair DNA endonuclease (very short patch repair protein)